MKKGTSSLRSEVKKPFRDALSDYFMLTELEIDHFSIQEVKTVLVLLL